MQSFKQDSSEQQKYHLLPNGAFLSFVHYQLEANKVQQKMPISPVHQQAQIPQSLHPTELSKEAGPAEKIIK